LKTDECEEKFKKFPCKHYNSHANITLQLNSQAIENASAVWTNSNRLEDYTERQRQARRHQSCH